MAEGEGFEPPVRFPVQRFSSTQEGSEPFVELCTLPYLPIAYQPSVLIVYGWICSVLSMELLQFYYSPSTLTRHL